jgi:hypothetical protein
MAQNIEFNWKFNNSDLDAALSKWKDLNKEIHSAAKDFEKLNKAAKNMKAPDPAKWKEVSNHIKTATQALMKFNQAASRVKAPSLKGWQALYGVIEKCHIGAERLKFAARAAKGPSTEGWKSLQSEIEKARKEAERYNKESGRAKGPKAGGAGGGRGVGGGGGGGGKKGGGMDWVKMPSGLGSGGKTISGALDLVRGKMGGIVTIADGLIGIFKSAASAAWDFAKATTEIMVDFGKAVYKSTAEYQTFTSQLAVMFSRDTKETPGKEMEKSYAMAERTMIGIQELAAKTPLSVEQITKSYIALSRRGLRPTEKQLIALGDLAAAGGKKMTQLAEAILDAQQGEKERLKEFGIEMKESQGKITLSVGKIKVEGKQILETFTKLGEQKGISGAMLEAAKTIGGLFSTTKDQIDQLLTKIGTTPVVLESFKVGFQFVTSAAEGLMRVFGSIVDFIGETIRPTLNNMLEVFKPIIDTFTSFNPDLKDEEMKKSGDNVHELKKKFFDTGKAVEWFKGVFRTMGAWIAKVFDLLQPKLDNLWKAFKELFGAMDAADKAGADVKAFGASANAAAEMIGPLIDALAALVGWFAKGIKPDKDGMNGFIEDMITMKNVTLGFMYAYVGAVKVVSGTVRSLWELVKLDFSGFMDASWDAQEGWEKIGEAMGKIGSSDAEIEEWRKKKAEPIKMPEEDPKKEGGFEAGTDAGVTDKDKKKKEEKPEDPFDLEMANLKRWHQRRLFEIDESMGAEKKTQAENEQEILDQEVDFLDKKWELTKKYGKLTNASNIEMETEGDKLHQDFQKKVWEREYATLTAQIEIRLELEMTAAKDLAIAKRTNTEELDRQIKNLQQKAHEEQTILMKTYGKLSEAEELKRQREMGKMSEEYNEKMRLAEIEYQQKKLDSFIVSEKYRVERYGETMQQSAEYIAVRLLEVEENRLHREHRLQEQAGTLTLAQQEEFGAKLLGNKQEQYQKLGEMAKKAVDAEKRVNREMLERSTAIYGILNVPAFGEMILGVDDYKNKIKEANKELMQMEDELQKVRRSAFTEAPGGIINKEAVEQANKIASAIAAAKKNLEGMKIDMIAKAMSKMLEGIGQAIKATSEAIDQVFQTQINEKDKQLAQLDAEEDKLKKIVDQEQKRADILAQQQGIINSMAEQRIKELEFLTTTVPEAERARVAEDIEFEKQRIRAVEQARENAASAEKNRMKRIEKDREKIEKQKMKLQEKQFEVQRAAQIAQTIINTAVGVTQTIASVPKVDFGVTTAALIGLYTATGIAQAATIASQPNPYKQYKDGTLFVDMPGAARDRDSVPAMLMPGEAVIPTATNKKYGPALAAIYNSQIPPEMINGFVKDFKVGNIDPRIFGAHGGNVFVNAGMDADKIVKAIKEKETMSVNIDNEGFYAYIESHNEQTRIRDKKLHTSR